MKNLGDRINQRLDLANRTYETKEFSTGTFATSWVDKELFWEFRASSLSFILNIYGESHPYFTDFNRLVTQAVPSDTTEEGGILKSIKSEIDNG